MSIITPPVFTPTHQEETNHLNSVTEELVRKLIRNNNFLLDLAPIGTIIFINTNQPGAVQPNPDFWQICDGSQITNVNSPIRSIGLNLRYTPDFKNFYPRGASATNTNPTYGTHLHNLQHAHSTGLASADGGGLKKKGDRNRRNNHNHIIYSQYTEEVELISPAYYYVLAYMKIV